MSWPITPTGRGQQVFDGRQCEVIDVSFSLALGAADGRKALVMLHDLLVRRLLIPPPEQQCQRKRSECCR
ncbi:hypothetical protein [Mycobacteroides abscessus]|uniref:hypothetical protein n=1 Tax=Mycobacteroides abscessus TaxID=36809 RepID=UPI001F38A64C|nr:hypothetical protein [Mycobacteroides abscessus]